MALIDLEGLTLFYKKLKSLYYTKQEVDNIVTNYQSVKSINGIKPNTKGNIDIVTDNINSNSSLGISSKAVAQAISQKQDIIEDIDEIRENSLLGKTNALNISTKADKANVYTKSQVDNLISQAGKVQTVDGLSPDTNGNIALQPVYIGTDVPEGYHIYYDNTSLRLRDQNGNLVSVKIPQTEQKVELDWSNIHNKPTSLAEYGITNVYTKDEIDATLADYVKYGDTLSHYGIKNAYTKTEVDDLLLHCGKSATTIEGYGITDAYTKSTTDELLANKADKATTLAGYGITDTYTKSTLDSKFAQYTLKGTTLSDYGITDAYTIAEIDSKLAQKISKSNTLAGYGITNAYTQSEVDYYLSYKANKADVYTKTEVDNKIKGGLTYKGTVEYLADLPTDNIVGDVWHVNSIGKNYAWNGTKWDNISGEIDLSTKQDVISDLDTIRSNAKLGVDAYNRLDLDEEKLNTIETNAQVNVIEKIEVDGTELIPESKKVSIDLSGKQNVIGDLTDIRTGVANANLALEAINTKADKATTLAGYGITDAKIENDIITLGNQTVAIVSDVGNKQDRLSTEQLDAVNSGINLTKVATYDAYEEQIAMLDKKIGSGNTGVALSNDEIDELLGMEGE